MTGERFTATATAVAAEYVRAKMEDSTMVVTPEMAFRDCIAAWRASQDMETEAAAAHADSLRFKFYPDGDPEEPRATPARTLRLRLYTDRLEGPAWLGLLCQCAWLRGVVGSAVPTG